MPPSQYLHLRIPVVSILVNRNTLTPLQTVDLIDAPLYIGTMNTAQQSNKASQDDSDIDRLESGLDELIQLCERLHTENNVLRGHQKPLVTERTRLIETNSLVRNKMEAVIKRLKTMEAEL